MCYKCNNLGHIAQNCHAHDDQQNPRRRALVFQLCNNFRHTSKYCRMDRNFRDRRNNGRNFGNKRNDGKNIKNDRRNHERNSRTNKENEEQRNVVTELWEEHNEAFLKGVDISKENLDDYVIGKSKLVIKFDLIKVT